MYEQLRKLQLIELEIAKEVKRICEKYDIKYYLIAGTLLGAVRHNGFIPWDDDMDIGMLRSDYERFIEVCKTDLQEDFFLQTWDTDPEYPFSYAKIRLNGTHIVESISEKAKMHNGIFVDIFPFDSAPEEEKEQEKQAKKYFFYKRLLWIKKGMGKNLRGKKRIKYLLFSAVARCFNYKKAKERYQKIQGKYNQTKTKKVVTDGAYNYNKETLKREWFNEQEVVLFESIEFTTFKKKEEYLTYFYGDYMTLPPVDKRGGHNPKIIDFGKFNKE